MTGVTVTPSPTLASTASTYAVGFKSTSGVPGGGYICLGEPNTSFSNALRPAPTLAVLVTDTTTGPQYVAPAANVTDTRLRWRLTVNTHGCGCTHVHAIQAVNTINAGDQVTVTVTNVNNPTTVGRTATSPSPTSIDTVAVDAPAYQIGVSSNGGRQRGGQPGNAGARWRLTPSPGMHASAAIGSAVPPSLSQPSRAHRDRATRQRCRLHPDRLHDDHGFGWSQASGYLQLAMTSAVTLAVPNAINSGDMLTITIDGVINPPLAGSYSIAIGNANIAGPAVTAPVFPQGNVDAIRTAGSSTTLAPTTCSPASMPLASRPRQCSPVSRLLTMPLSLTAPTGATVPNTVPAVGTVIFIYNNPTIYVVGTDGQLARLRHPRPVPGRWLRPG